MCHITHVSCHTHEDELRHRLQCIGWCVCGVTHVIQKYKYMNESCRTYKCVISHTWEWVTSQMAMDYLMSVRCHTCMDATWHANEWVMSYIWINKTNITRRFFSTHTHTYIHILTRTRRKHWNMHHEMILCHARTHTHTHKRTRTHAHAHTHTRTCTHIYTQNHGAVLEYRALFLSIRTQCPVFRSNRYVQIHQKPHLSIRIALSFDQNAINPYRADSQQMVGFDSVE